MNSERWQLNVTMQEFISMQDLALNCWKNGWREDLWVTGMKKLGFYPPDHIKPSTDHPVVVHKVNKIHNRWTPAATLATSQEKIIPIEELK